MPTNSLGGIQIVQEIQPIDIIITATIFLVSVAIAAGLFIIFKRYISRIAAKRKTRLDDYAIRLVKGPIFIIILLNGATRALGYWTGKYPGTLPSSLELGSDALILVAVVLIIVTVANLVFNEVLSNRLRKVIAETPDKETSFRLLSRLASYVIYIIGIVAILAILFPGGTQALFGALVGAGFLAIVIGLAAQKVIGNFLSGLSINITRPIRIGDAVKIKGEYGYIEDITFRHTVIRTPDNKRLIIPNSVLDDEVIVNYTLKDPRMVLPVTVQIGYESNVEKAMMVLKEIAKNHHNCLPEMNPETKVLCFGDNGVTLQVEAMAKDQPTAVEMGSDIRREILKRFPKEGIVIPYPRRYLIFGEAKSQLESFTAPEKSDGNPQS